MKTLIVIPSRIGSTRFPGKPLHEIAGHSLLARVIDVARRVADSDPDTDFLVATDHEDIRAHAEACGARAVMTDPELPSGTDRALAAVETLDQAPDFVVNLQGDAPFTPVEQIRAIIEAGATSSADVVTPVIRLDWDALDEVRQQKERHPFSGTTCIRRSDGEALWFSKLVLPAMRKEAELREQSAHSPVWRHIGLYGYRMDALRRFAALPVGHYEALEGLEQLRFLENGMRIHAVEVEAAPLSMWGIDTPEDAVYAERELARLGDPYGAG